jgi:hypothetical protein
MEGFSEAAFRSKVNEALGRIKTILDTTRNPQIADEVQHRYEDKYLLAELLTNASLGASINALDAIGLNAKSKRSACSLD